ncbi:hypothetical protein [Streptomyces sp. NPDC048639]|uniref:hypothetical protein n=1 Tax=Streptomyces sp. NPDC048639 TaxID=3365581 RepID=UPI003710B5A7
MTESQPLRGQLGPVVGDLAKDTSSGRVGIVMGTLGGSIQLRPVNGGTEWDVRPDRVRSLTAREELSARLAIRNHDTVRGWGK